MLVLQTFTLAGFFAGITEAIIINPFEVVKVQLQAERGKFVQVKCFVECNSVSSVPEDNIWAMIIVWRISGKIVKTVLCCIMYESMYSNSAHTSTDFLPMPLAREVMQSPPSIRLYIRFHSNFWTEWPLTLIFCMCMDGSGFLLSWDWRSKLGLGSQFDVLSVGTQSSIEDSFLVHWLLVLDFGLHCVNAVDK